MRKTVLRLAILAVSLFCLAAPGEGGDDVAGQLDTLSWKVGYDEQGLVNQVVGPGGMTDQIDYSFDNNKRLRKLTRRSGDGEQAVFEFDALGRRSSMTDHLGVVRYTYDEFNRLTTVKRDGQPAIIYGYDESDHVASVSVGDEFSTKYTYDFLGRLEAVESPMGKITYDYQPGLGAISRTLPNGIWTRWEYGPDHKLKSLTHAKKDNSVILRFDYSYRPDGIIKSIKEWSPQVQKTIVYEYDNVQRLTAVNDSVEGISRYAYDSVGNRSNFTGSDGKSIKSEYDWAGRLTRKNGKHCTQDAGGNLTSYPGQIGAMKYQYDQRNLLTTAGVDTERVEYQYDGEGQLVTRERCGKMEHFVPNPLARIWQPLFRSDSEMHHTFYLWAGKEALAEYVNNRPRFFLEDHLGSVFCIVDADGNIIDQHHYDVFGASSDFPDKTEIEPGFAGLFWDSAASLYLTKARSYSPELGSFLQRDPKRHVPSRSQKTLASYSYCGDDPVNWSDRDGAEPTIAEIVSQMQAQQAQTQDSQSEMLWQQQQMVEEIRDQLQGSGFSSISSENTEKQSLMREQQSEMLWEQQQIVGQLREQAESVGPTEGLGTAQFTSSILRTEGIAVAVQGLRLGEFLTTFSSGVWPAIGGGLAGGFANVLGDKIGLPESPLGHEEDAFTFGSIGKDLLAGQFIDSLRGVRDYLVGKTTEDTTEQSPKVDGLCNIGGISLAGAGEALKAMGALQGIALGKNGQLVLISEEQGELGLPPLRLDDVVAIFRSVYEAGESPWVSIDPDPKDPTGPVMIPRQSEIMKNTYPQWVLFEADRVMKGFSVGEDNMTKQPIKTSIPGYGSIVDLGFSSHSDDQTDPVWERFWIVPQEVIRHQTESHRLTLLDVPLKVKTQRMVMRDGVLEPAPNPVPTVPAQKFSDWFTANYQALCKEIFTQPPKEGGFEKTVATYEELERVALITGIAETLRDQGVPMPRWMRDYSVLPCPVPPTTPSISMDRSITSTNGSTGAVQVQTRHIYGGVNLAPDDQNLRTVSGGGELEDLALEISNRVPLLPQWGAVSFKKNGKEYHVVALPGNDTSDLGPCQLQEEDLVVTVRQETKIRLTRYYNSFFRPQGELGSGWTLDLPQLISTKEPTARSDDTAQFKIVYNLTTPLDTISATFRERKFVPELNGEILIPSQPGSILGLADGEIALLETNTQEVIFRNGNEWHFDSSGNLVATVAGPLIVIYRRDDSRKLSAIEGWYGGKQRAKIKVEYDSQGRLISAVGSNKRGVHYNYDSSNCLATVGFDNEQTDYRYRNGFLSDVIRNGKPLRHFETAENGRLERSSLSGKEEFSYSRPSLSDGAEIDVSSNGGQVRNSSVKYDNGMRPVRRIRPDGTQIDWRYQNDGVTQITVRQTNGHQFTLSRTADGKRDTWQLPSGGKCALERDDAGRTTSLFRGDLPIFSQKYAQDGQLSEVESPSAKLHADYGNTGLLKSVFVSPPDADTAKTHWVRVRYDEDGRPIESEDSTGSTTQVRYDTAGRPTEWRSNRGSVTAQRSDKGNITKMSTSWGYSQTSSFDPKTDALNRIVATSGGAEASADFDQGLVMKVVQFDGGKTEFAYDDDGKSKRLLKQVHTPNNLVVNYGYDGSDRLTSVDCLGAYGLRYKYDARGRLTGLEQVPPALGK